MERRLKDISGVFRGINLILSTSFDQKLNNVCWMLSKSDFNRFIVSNWKCASKQAQEFDIKQAYDFTFNRISFFMQQNFILYKHFLNQQNFPLNIGEATPAEYNKYDEVSNNLISEEHVKKFVPYPIHDLNVQDLDLKAVLLKY